MSKPLRGRRIVVTRSPEQAPAFCDRLAQVGAEPIAFPTIQFLPLPAEPLDHALRQLDDYDWLIFTSANAVQFFFTRVDELGLAPTLPRIAAVGPATAAVLAERGVAVAFVPNEFVGEELVLGLGDLVGQRLLLPRARIGRPKIVEMLRRQGAQVDDVPLYDTVTANPDPAALAALAQGIDAITFTSPSSVRNFLKILEEAGFDRAVLSSAAVACIGPVTAQATRDSGLPVAIMPDDYTIEGLIQALTDFYDEPSSKHPSHPCSFLSVFTERSKL